MQRKTIIFGNGLGMAHCPEHYSLDQAIGQVWGNASLLDEASKQLIRLCLPDQNDERPRGEEDLDTLQTALSACDVLLGIGSARIHWLSEQGQAFPNAIRNFIFHTALHFHARKVPLPDGFVDPLARFITDTNSHIATLNYDNLLYSPMINRRVMSGYDGSLVDGFHGAGFRAGNLERKFGREFGYYLHLHGSPLFFERGGAILKLPQRELAYATDTVSSHIVLTHFHHKTSVISASDVLLSYWRKLVEAINESNEVILFGYSGKDEHLNSLLTSASGVPVRVVEWNGAGSEDERLSYWSEQLKRAVSVTRMPNILDFRGWRGDA